VCTLINGLQFSLGGYLRLRMDWVYPRLTFLPRILTHGVDPNKQTSVYHKLDSLFVLYFTLFFLFLLVLFLVLMVYMFLMIV
jgi:hypothetical protein